MQRSTSQDLGPVKDKILQLGSRVEGMLEAAVSALGDRDAHAAEETIASDQRTDALEMELKEACLRLLPLHRSAAADLRYIGTAMKISTHLEQMADEAVGICQCVLEPSEQSQLQARIDFPAMSQLSQKLLRNGLDAFVRQDVALAQEVTAADIEVAALTRLIHREVLILMVENPRTVAHGMWLLAICRHLERIADHVMKIAGRVIFLAERRNGRRPPTPKTSKKP